jgi:alkylation response protein AidB-like acyl-CoA dehydrogenase
MLFFPSPPQTDSLATLRTEVRAFLTDQRARSEFDPVSSGWMVYDRKFSQACGARGYIGIAWPEMYGGGGLTQLERYVVVEELLAAGAPLGAHWVTDRQSGPQIIWTTNGHRADYMIGLFRTDPRLEAQRHRGMTQFVVDLTSRGVSRRPIEDLNGEDDFSEITFDDVFVPDINVLGEPGSGWELVMGELAYERSGPERFLSVYPLLQQAIEAGAEAFDGGSASALGRLVARIAILRQMSLSISGRIAAGDLPALEAALVKDMGNRFEQEIPEALRTLGVPPAFIGSGLQSKLAAAVIAAPSFTLRGGTPEILRGIIARGLGLR